MSSALAVPVHAAKNYVLLPSERSTSGNVLLTRSCDCPDVCRYSSSAGADLGPSSVFILAHKAWCSLQGMETKPAPGDAGTDSGSDDEAKQLQSAAEQELRNHRKRKTEVLKQKPVGPPEGDSGAVPAQAQAHQAANVPEHAGESWLPYLGRTCTWPLEPCTCLFLVPAACKQFKSPLSARL